MGAYAVTGASSGLGRAIYNHFLGKGVIGISRHGPDIHVDLSTPEGVDSVVRKLSERPLSCLVNCAGVLHLGSDDALHHRQIFDLNFWTPYYLSTYLQFEMGASIINMVSVSGLMADPETPVYGASKAALISLTRSLAVKWAPRVRVNAISPGFFDTNLVPEPTPRNLIDPVPMGFEATTEMILPVMDMLLDCPYITGANVVVDGGLSARVHQL